MLNQLTTLRGHVDAHSNLDHFTARNTDKLIDQYNRFLLKSTIELSSATVTDYTYKMRVFVRYCLELNVTKLKDINTDQIRGFIAHMQQTNSPKSVNGYFKVVKSFFSWLVNDGRLKNNPTLKVKSPRVPHKIVKIFNTEHIRDILLLCKDGTKTGIRNKAIVLTLLDTGLRLSELACIQVDDIDIKRGIITIMGKGARQRVVGISKKTLKAIVDYYESRPGEHQQLWLTEEGHPITKVGIGMIFKTLKRRAGFKDVRLSAHTFRHTSGTMAILNGASEREVQMLLGHSSNRMTQEYTATITSHHAVLRHKEFSPVDKLIL